MKERISKLAKGILEREIPRLQMTKSSFKQTLSLGESHKISTILSAAGDALLKGLIYSTNPRVRPEKEAFGGLRSRVECEVDTDGLMDGDTIEGMLIIVSNAGEWQLPYLFLLRGDKEKNRIEPRLRAPEKGDYPGLLSDAKEDDSTDFLRYEEEIAGGSSELHLYERYLMALPIEYTKPLLREVYLYFDYEKNIAEELALRLYSNIVTALGEEDDIYRRFERRIREFAVEGLLKRRIDERYAEIYRHILYPEMLDERVARYLPEILSTFRISVNAKGITAAVLRFPELMGEKLYPVREGIAYIPVPVSDGELFFKDEEGNIWQLPYEKKRLIEREELFKRAMELSTDKALYRLERVVNIVKRGIQKPSQLSECEEVFRELRLSDSFRALLLRAVLNFHSRLSLSDREGLKPDDIEFIKSMPVELLERTELKELLGCLIRLSELSRASELYREYSFIKLEKDLLEPLMIFRIEELDTIRRNNEDGRAPRALIGELCLDCYRAFRLGSRNRELLLYLLSNYSSSSWEMLELLREAAASFCPSGDYLRDMPEEERAALHQLAERLLAQMLFTGMEEGMDECYALYLESGELDSLLWRAYISRKAELYFLRERETDREFFTMLYGIIHGELIKERVPLIYLLAMSRHMADRDELSDEEKLELQEMLRVLMEKRLIFAYTERLEKFIPLPEPVLERSYIEYRAASDERPIIKVRLLSEDEEFHEEELERVYHNIYVCPLLLFYGEEAEYRIYRLGEQNPVQQGTVRARTSGGIKRRADSYQLLNEMSELLEKKKSRELRDSMLAYARNEAMILKLFGEQSGREI